MKEVHKYASVEIFNLLDRDKLSVTVGLKILINLFNSSSSRDVQYKQVYLKLEIP